MAESRIVSLSFRFTGDADHELGSHAEIKSNEMFDADNRPVEGGVYDLRMGTTEHAYDCTTCGLNKRNCLGHRGSLQLRAAVLSPVAVEYVRRWLRVVCLRCGALTADRERVAALPPSRRLAESARLGAETRRCPACGLHQDQILKDAEDTFSIRILPAGVKRPARNAPQGGARLYPDAIARIFDKVSDADVAFMGCAPTNHPRVYVIRTVLVPPNTIRPGVKNFAGSGNSYHDCTNLLQALLRKNADIPDPLPRAVTEPASGEAVPFGLEQDLLTLEQIYNSMIYSAPATSAAQGVQGRRGLVIGSRPVSSFMRNLSRKEGRIRASGLGKRVVYICRSTISGNSSLRPHEVAVPLQFARSVQVAEVVRQENLARLLVYYTNGRRAYPGSTLVHRAETGEVYDVEMRGEHSRLEIGDTLYRDLVDGDPVFLNRAPSLERSSLGVHTAVVVLDPSVSTIGLNVLICSLYGADFNIIGVKQVAAGQGEVSPARANSGNTSVY